MMTMVHADVDAAVWRRAAVFGSLWAAVEIVIGSFLHTLRLPFAGGILSAFGVAVMTAAHRAVGGRGLIWRAALICALMKSLSPSAVILGPMIGIMMEGVLLEGAVRFSPSRTLGYLVGGAAAVSWSLVQRVLNTLLSYGPDVVRLYVEAYRYAARSLGVTGVGPFDLVWTLFGLECAVGATAGAVGLAAGRRVSADARAPARHGGGLPGGGALPGRVRTDWSIARLMAFTAALASGMFGLGVVPLPVGAAYVAVVAGMVLRTYPSALGRIRRPTLWVELAGVTVLAGLLLGGLHGGRAGLREGTVAGVEMALRATLAILGFTAISVELRNPRILAALERRRLKGLSAALTVAFGTLPAFTEALTSQRASWRAPGAAIRTLLRIATDMACAAAPPAGARSRATLITGQQGSGKTTCAAAVVDRLRRRGLDVGGILAPGLLHDGHRTGFDIVDVASGRLHPLCREREGPGDGGPGWRRFEFDPGGLDLGNQAIRRAMHKADVVVVDEVGPWELSGGGWADSLDALASEGQSAMLIVARDASSEQVIARWGSPATSAFAAGTTDPDVIAAHVAKAVEPERGGASG